MILFSSTCIECDGIQKEIIDNAIKRVNSSFECKRTLLTDPFCAVDKNMYSLFTAIMVHAMITSGNHYLADPAVCTEAKTIIDLHMDADTVSADVDYLTHNSILDCLALSYRLPDYDCKYLLSLLLCKSLYSVTAGEVSRLQSIITNAITPKVISVDWANNFLSECSDYLIDKYFPLLKDTPEQCVDTLSLLLLTRMYAVCYDYIGSYWHRNCICANKYSKDKQYSIKLVELLSVFSDAIISPAEVVTAIDGFIYRSASYIYKK